MPHLAPGAPQGRRAGHLSGKPIRDDRPKGSADIRHLMDEGFQAFNAPRKEREHPAPGDPVDTMPDLEHHR